MTVSNGEEALEAAVSEPPDLILSDVMMPGLDGFGLLKELRARAETRTIPVVLLSARAGEESRVEGLGAGADDYLIKPFTARELLARVAAHLSMRRRRMERRGGAEGKPSHAPEFLRQFVLPDGGDRIARMRISLRFTVIRRRRGSSVPTSKVSPARPGGNLGSRRRLMRFGSSTTGKVRQRTVRFDLNIRTCGLKVRAG